MKFVEIPFTFDQQDYALNPLLLALQKILRQTRADSPPNALEVLIIEMVRERGQYIATMLNRVGYRPALASSLLEGYTQYLRGAIVPFAVILGQEDGQGGQFFLQRLILQITQKHHWEPALIRLQFQSTAVEDLQPSQRQSPNTGPSLPLPQLTPALPVTPRPGSLKAVNTATGQKVPRTAMEGQNIGRYQIEKMIGEGPVGSVYLAYDRLREQQVALKVVAAQVQMEVDPDEDEEEVPEFFQREANLLGALDHPHLLPLYSNGMAYTSGFPFTYRCMPYYTQESLARWLTRHSYQRFFSPLEVAPVVMQLGNVLQYTHEHNILHLNFKLSNLLVHNKVRDLNEIHLVLADFSLTQDVHPSRLSIESYSYAPPEFWSGEYSAASDQYSLAALAYELLAGRPPLRGESESVMRMLHANIQPLPLQQINTTVSPWLSDVVMHALEKKPKDRFASIAMFAQLFQHYAQASA